MTPQQKLANRIYELLPHKKELEFGCEIIYGSDFGGEPRKVTIGNPYSVEKGKVLNPWNRDDTDDLFEIIGQPLHLADLLLAISGTGGRGGIISIETPDAKEFDIEDYYVDTMVAKILSDYNLQNDNILNQSDELCEFCLELLNNK